MNFFKNLLKKDTYLFPDLKPGDRIYKIISEYIFPDLEKIGFKISKTPLTMRRKVGDVEQEIYFQKNRNNSGKYVVAFLPHFTVTSKWYVEWCIEKYNAAPLNEYIIGTSAAYIPNWDKKYFNFWYDLAKHDNLEIANALKNNINKHGLPYLDIFSDKQKTINYILGTGFYHYMAPMLFDFAFMLNDKQQAKKILNWFTEYQNSTNGRFQDFTIRDILDRQDAFNNWV
jgi:hypothetical protein